MDVPEIDVTTMPRNAFLLVIGDRTALGWILTESRMAFPRSNRAEVRALEVGDRLYLYTTRGCFKNPTRDRGRIIGTATVISPVAPLDPPPMFGGRAFPIGCDLRLGPIALLHRGVELAQIVAGLDAFESLGASWSIGLRRPLVSFSERDSGRLDQLLSPW